MAASQPDLEAIGINDVKSELNNIATILTNIESSLKGGAPAEGGGTTSTPPRLNNLSSLSGATATAGQTISGMANWADKRAGAVTGQSTPPVRAMQNAGQFLQTAGNDYMPMGAQVASNFASVGKKIGGTSSNLIATGAASGYDPTGGDVSLGPFGMRTPFSAAGAVGLDQRIQAGFSSLGAGITYSGARGIQQGLEDRGYQAASTGPIASMFGIQNRSANDNYNRMYDTLTQVAKTVPGGQQLATDPMTMDLLDRSTRMGASGTKQFLETMQQMPNVMQAAQISQKQFLADMNNWGNYAQQKGSTVANGMKVGAAMENASGMPGGVLQQGMQGGFVTANLMRQTGLMPWQLGQATAGQNLQALYGTMGQLNKSLGTPADKTSTNAEGFTHVNTGQDQKDATIAMMMNLPVSVIKKMRRDRKGVEARAGADQNFQDQSDLIHNIAYNSKLSPAERQRRIAQLQSGSGGRGSFEMLSRDMHKAGFSKDEIAAVEKEGRTRAGNKTGTAAQVAAQAGRYARFQQIEAKKAGNTNRTPGDVQIEFGPGAKKFFKLLQDGKPTDAAKVAAKAMANAGGPSTVNSTGATPTYAGASGLPGDSAQYIGQ